MVHLVDYYYFQLIKSILENSNAEFFLFNVLDKIEFLLCLSWSTALERLPNMLPVSPDGSSLNWEPLTGNPLKTPESEAHSSRSACAFV